MKYIWEEHDIKPGKFVCKSPRAFQGEQLPHTTYQIAFDPSKENITKYKLVSITDGMILNQTNSIGFSAKKLADYLNENCLGPISHQNLIKVITQMRDWDKNL